MFKRSTHCRVPGVAISKLLLLFFVAFATLAVSSAPALAVTEGTGWEATSSVSPTNLPPGGTGEIQLNIINTGAKPSTGSITVTNALPAGVSATAAGGMSPTRNEIFS